MTPAFCRSARKRRPPADIDDFAPPDYKAAQLAARALAASAFYDPDGAWVLCPWFRRPNRLKRTWLTPPPPVKQRAGTRAAPKSTKRAARACAAWSARSKRRSPPAIATRRLKR